MSTPVSSWSRRFCHTHFLFSDARLAICRGGIFFPAVVLTLCVIASTSAQTTIQAVNDHWIRENDPSWAYENDGVSVWSTSKGDRRYGLIEFDLSSLAGSTVAEASLGMYSAVHGYSDYTAPIRQSAYVISGSTGGLSWNTYMSQKDAGKADLETLGFYDLPAASGDSAQQNAFVYSTASSNDLVLIQSAINGNGVFSIVLIADESDVYGQSWGDGDVGWSGPAPVLVFTASQGKAYAPGPSVGEELALTSATLSWRVHEPFYVQTPSYEVFLSTNSDPGFSGVFPVAVSTTSFAPEPELEYETTYYWRVDVIDPANGEPVVYTGDVWSFTTMPEALAPADPITCPAGDADSDCDVDFDDLLILSERWFGSETDLSGFAVLAADWCEKIGPAVISEFLAGNDNDLPDGNGESSDWIEIYNPTGLTVDLGGWYLTDESGDPTKWRFPAGVSIETGEYMVVFASRKREQDHPDNYPYIDPLGYFHTNFRLSAGGEYLGLVAPDGETVVHEYAAYKYSSESGFPPQKVDISYGLYDGRMRYFANTTPGKANDSSFVDFVEDTIFSHKRGFYEVPFNVSIICRTSDSTIYYTLDGSSPIDGDGNRTDTAAAYTGPLGVSSTTCLRAAAVRSGWRPSNVDSQTYLFTEDIIQQPQMDTDVAGPGDLFNGIYAATIKDDLKSIPTLSIVMNNDDIFGSNGIYTNPQGRGLAWERACSTELIHSDGKEGFQINSGIRMFGQGGRAWPKKSFRLLFKDIYGPGKLEYPLFPDGPVGRFNTVVLRCTVDTSWIDVRSTVRQRAQYIRDLWTKDTARDMGQELALHSTYVHLYFNGTYWGLFAVAERPDASYMTERLGGNKADYDAIVCNDVVDGSITAWDNLIGIANAGIGDGVMYGDITAYEAVQQRFDVGEFIDYILANFYNSNIDWPGHLGNRNWRAAGPRQPGQGGFRLFSWDAEICFDSGWSGVVRPVDYDNVSTMQDTDRTPARLYQRLRDNSEYRMLFADHVHRHCFNDGALTPQKVRDRWMARAAEIDRAVVPESARWGDERQSAPHTRNIDWLGEQNRMLTQWFPYRTDILVDLLRQNNLYSQVDAPVFRVDGFYKHGGSIDVDSDVTMILPSSEPGDMLYQTLVASFTSCKALVPTGDSLQSTWYLPGFVPDASWTDGSTGVGYDYPGLINTDVGSQMYDPYTSVYVRIPFTVQAEVLGVMESLTLRMKYEDGFVAYLNGVKVESDNADRPLVWEPIPAATSSRADSQAVQFRDFDLTPFMDRLQAGANLLAIHGLNVPDFSTDLLVLPELIAGWTGQGGQTLPGGVDIYYTTDGSDPRLPGGGVNVGPAFQYSGAIELEASTHVKARTYDGDSQTWSALNEAVYAVGPVVESLRITEIMYHPETPPNSAADAEFIELKNVGDAPLDLNLVRFVEGIDFTFGPLAVPAGGFVVVVKDEQVFRESHRDFAGEIAGVYDGRLANEGERIRLEDAIGRTVVDFKYKDGWRDITDGGGFSLTVIDPEMASAAEWGLERTWRASIRAGGSPGGDDGGVLPNPGEVVINEVLAHSHDLSPDWVELHNTTNHGISLKGWFLSDSDQNEPNLMKYEIGEVSIAAGGFVVFRENIHFHNLDDPGCEVPFALSENGEMVCLSSPVDIEGRLTGYRRKQVFGASLRDISFGRYHKSTGTWNFVSMSENTPGANFEGAPNAYPQVGPVVISEIMYHPDWPADSLYENDEYEYIELLNVLEPGAEAIVLGGESSGWKFTDGIKYAFGPGTLLSSGQRIVVARNPEAFLARYPYIAPETVFGPFEDDTGLSNSGESIELSRPGEFDGRQHYVVVDRINYSDGSNDEEFEGGDPWPAEADGKGQSLIRIAPNQYGNDVANWQGGQASPQM